MDKARRSILFGLCMLPFGAAVPMSIKTTLKHWGSGEYRRFGLLIYEATLMAGNDPLEPPLALRLDYRRSISSSDIVKASLREMSRTVYDSVLLEKWEKQLNRIIPNVKRGDHIVGHYTPKGAVFSQGLRTLGQIDDLRFAEAFFGIWLDPRTSAPGLRANLLKLT